MLFRNAYELGGIYFSFNLFTTQLTLLIAAYLYNNYFEDESEEQNKTIDSDLVWGIATGLLFTWTCIFTLFVWKVANPRMRSSFWSTQTGWERTCGLFHRELDWQKIQVFGDNRIMWKSIEGEVKEWTLANWARWEKERPPFFTKQRIAMIPDEFIPDEFLQKRRNEAKGGKERSRKGSVRVKPLSVREMQQFKK